MIEVIWNEDMGIVYARKICFKDENAFKNKVIAEYKSLTGDDCIVSNIEIKSCISTERGVEPETITPLEETDVEINTFYIADVEKEA